MSIRKMTLDQLIKENRINIDPSFWGDNGWTFLFSTGFGYPNDPTEEEINDAEHLILSLRSMLACLKCRGNYTNHLSKLLTDRTIYSSKENFIKCLVDIKNEVNKSLNKPVYSYDDTVNYYYKKIYKKNTTSSSTITLILLIAVLLFIVYLCSR
jgi:hypothetical protein